jgi:hypothetical protein
MAAESLSLRVALQGLLFSVRAMITVARAEGDPTGPKLLEMADKATARAERVREMALAAQAVRPHAGTKLDAIRQTIDRILEALPGARANAPASEGAHAAVDVLLAAAQELEGYIHRPLNP